MTSETPTDLRSVLLRARGSLAGDAVGLVSLVAMLIVALHLPGMV